MSGGVFNVAKSLGWIQNYKSIMIASDLEDDSMIGLGLCCKIWDSKPNKVYF